MDSNTAETIFSQDFVNHTILPVIFIASLAIFFAFVTSGPNRTRQCLHCTLICVAICVAIYLHTSVNTRANLDTFMRVVTSVTVAIIVIVGVIRNLFLRSTIFGTKNTVAENDCTNRLIDLLIVIAFGNAIWNYALGIFDLRHGGHDRYIVSTDHRLLNEHFLAQFKIYAYLSQLFIALLSFMIMKEIKSKDCDAQANYRAKLNCDEDPDNRFRLQQNLTNYLKDYANVRINDDEVCNVTQMTAAAAARCMHEVNIIPQQAYSSQRPDLLDPRNVSVKVPPKVTNSFTSAQYRKAIHEWTIEEFARIDHSADSPPFFDSSTFTLDIPADGDNDGDNLDEKEGAKLSLNDTQNVRRTHQLEFYLRVYPRGKQRNDNVSLYLHCRSCTTIAVSFTLGMMCSFILIDEHGRFLDKCHIKERRIKFRDHAQRDCAFGWDRFITRHELLNSKYLNKGNLKIQCLVSYVVANAETRPCESSCYQTQ